MNKEKLDKKINEELSKVDWEKSSMSIGIIVNSIKKDSLDFYSIPKQIDMEHIIRTLTSRIKFCESIKEDTPQCKVKIADSIYSLGSSYLDRFHNIDLNKKFINLKRDHRTIIATDRLQKVFLSENIVWKVEEEE